MFLVKIPFGLFSIFDHDVFICIVFIQSCAEKYVVIIMSRKIVAQCCAICEREKKSAAAAPQTPLDLGSLGEGRGNSITRHKYGHLPAKKTDDFIQVTEPQWLRRGNLKESDFVCKRHLAILMRGVDRGCEGGCCSPLHRGARIGRPGTLRAIPSTWRKRFVQHPKIKDEDKEVMMFCWECYKKHMNRMSKHGDPMGRADSAERTLRRSQSVVDSDDSGSSILEAMKKYKSMDKLDSVISPSAANAKQRRASSSSSSPRHNGDLSRGSKINESDIRSTPARRTNRGRRSQKGKRSSPSPPNNISPVRTSVVHSKRKHSPHKSPKSPSAWRYDTSSLEASPRNQTRLSVDEGALADTESPRDPPIPPPGLFSFRMDANDEVFDVFAKRSIGKLAAKTTVKESNGPLSDTSDKNDKPPQTDSKPGPPNQTPLEYDTSIPENGILEYKEPEQSDIPNKPSVLESNVTPLQTEECTTSADEMAAIFANHPTDDGADNADNNESLLVQELSGLHTIPEPELSDPAGISDNIATSHQHENSSSNSSDKTGDTQIEREDYGTSEPRNETPLQPTDIEVTSIPTPGSKSNDDILRDTENLEKYDDIIQNEKSESTHKETPTISSTGFSDSSFLSPVRQNRSESSPVPTTSISYSLSPQSFRRLESLRLQFHEDLSSTEDAERRQQVYFDDDVREKSHPMRNNVIIKLPKEHNGTLPYSYIRLPAEDVEIFPDTMSFLDGITQTMGDEMTMYAQDGVRIVAVDLKHGDNRKTHRTSYFSDEFLIARRGQPVEIELQLNEKYDEEKHKVMAELLIGESPRVSNGTHIFIPIQRSGTSAAAYGAQPSQWSGCITKAEDNKLTLMLTSNSTCPIGSYALYFQIEKGGSRSRWQGHSECDRKIVVIFNPWNIDDAVFMSSHADRQEYVVCDAGCMYSGSKANLLRIPWIYGQYEPGVLQACIGLVESSGLTSTARGDPVSVAKAVCKRLTQLLEQQSPSSRMKAKESPRCCGAEILQKLFQTGVLVTTCSNRTLAALLVTVFRCIGLPARPVTCVNYALQTDLPMNINVHYSREGHALDHMNTDKLWPSYTWAGIWMSRVDLPPGFGGWQALLPPTSGRGSVGPIPAYGIKKGQTSCCEGTKEHFLSLNAHKKFWVVLEDGNMQNVATDFDVAGAAIVTKSVASLDHQDVTKLYKFAEGCEEQKLAIHTACMHCGNQNSPDEPYRPKPLSIALSTNPPVISLGNDVDVVTKIKNDASDVKHLNITLDVAILAEDGTAEMKVQRETILAEVLPNASVEIQVKLNLAPCLHKLTRDRHLLLCAVGNVRNMDSEKVIGSHLVGIKYPEIEIQLHGEFKVGGEVTVLSKIRNPLPYPLTNAKISLNSTGLSPLETTTTSFGKSVGPWQVCKSESVYRCQRLGKHTIVATFFSDHLNGPVGAQEIEIT